MKYLAGLLLTLGLLTATAHASAASTNGTAVLTVTTLPTSGRYAPRHVMAVWITDQQNKLVKTIAVQAGKRKKYLELWREDLGKQAPDGIVGATRKEHAAQTFTWDTCDQAGQPVAPGLYRWRVEFTDRNKMGPSTPADYLTFTVGPEPTTNRPADLPFFHDLGVTYTPGTP